MLNNLQYHLHTDNCIYTLWINNSQLPFQQPFGSLVKASKNILYRFFTVKTYIIILLEKKIIKKKKKTKN